jgi:hypothetical protein
MEGRLAYEDASDKECERLDCWDVEESCVGELNIGRECLVSNEFDLTTDAGR